MNPRVTVVGGGLAGCEAAIQLARRGHGVRLVEMRPTRTTPAHQTDGLGELVCTNSFKSEDARTSCDKWGLYHEHWFGGSTLQIVVAKMSVVESTNSVRNKGRRNILILILI